MSFAGKGECVKNGYPESSNDFMPVEGIINDLKDLVWEKDPETMVDLYNKIKSAWKELPMSNIIAQIDRFPDTMGECICLKGYKTLN